MKIINPTLIRKNSKSYLNFINAHKSEQNNDICLNHYPWNITLDITSYCQLKCNLCPTGLQNIKKSYYREREHLNFELFRSLISEIGDYLFWVDCYNWGEPFVNKNLVNYLDLLSKYGIESRISSNLSVKLSEETIEQVVSSGLGVLLCSIDGIRQETYERYRSGGNIKLVLENLQKFQRVKDRFGAAHLRIIWNFMVFKWNQNEVEEARTMAKDMGVDFEIAHPFAPLKWKADLELHRVPEGIDNWSRVNAYREEYGEDYLINAPETKSCKWLYHSFALNGNGSVSPCCGIWYEKDDFGKLSEYETFYILWNNENYKLARGSLLGKYNQVICSNCPIPLIRGVDIGWIYNVEVRMQRDEPKLFEMWQKVKKECSGLTTAGDDVDLQKWNISIVRNIFTELKRIANKIRLY